MTVAKLREYGMSEIAEVTLPDPRTFMIRLINQNAGFWEKAIYAFIIGEEICRIGSSKDRLGKRLNRWEADVSARLRNMDANPKKGTPPEEAAGWQDRLHRHGRGFVYARPGTIVRTPIGEFPAYLDEESVLIGCHKPPFNRSKHR